MIPAQQHLIPRVFTSSYHSSLDLTVYLVDLYECGEIVVVPGNSATFRLAQDIVTDRSPCFSIANPYGDSSSGWPAGGAVLDGQGYSITSSTDSFGTAIHVDCPSTTVLNVHLSRWNTGVLLTANAFNSTITGVTITDIVDSDGGIISEAPGAIIANNFLSSITGNGIFTGGPDSMIANNYLTSFVGEEPNNTGIWSEGQRATIVNNFISNFQFHGIGIASYGPHATITDNVIAVTAGATNIYVPSDTVIYTSGPYSTISNNSLQFRWNGYEPQGITGIRCLGSNSTIAGNSISQFEAWSFTGIYLTGSSCLVTNNSIDQSNMAGGFYGITAYSSYSTFSHNSFNMIASGQGIGIQAWGMNNSITFNNLAVDATSSEDGAGITISNSAGTVAENNSIYVIGGPWVTVQGIEVFLSSTTALVNNAVEVAYDVCAGCDGEMYMKGIYLSSCASLRIVGNNVSHHFVS